MPSVTDPEIRAFLLEGTRTGKLSYCAADGRPLVVPVWFVIDDDHLVFNTGKNTAKGRALFRDPRAAICVDLEQPPYAFVQVQGVAALSEDPADLLAAATAIGARYMGPERAAEFGRRNAVPGELVVRLRPVKVVAAFNMIGLSARFGRRRRTACHAAQARCLLSPTGSGDGGWSAPGHLAGGTVSRSPPWCAKRWRTHRDRPR
jgi:PPOX class probable F420-dependent enzyme